MYRPLAPCPSCHRHCLTSDPRCPFCGAAMTASAPAAPRSLGRLSRAAVVMLGASLSMGCSSNQSKPSPDGSTDPPQPTVTATPPDDDGTVHAEYGAPIPAPPPTATTTPPDDNGAAAPKYGAPMPPPAQTKPVKPGPPDDNGGAVPKYGAPSRPLTTEKK